MPLRLLAFLPPALLITALILVSASSLVTAIDTKLLPPPEPTPMQVERYETPCDALHREIQELSRHVNSCEATTRCGRSPLLCAAATDASLEREYERLRSELNRQCGVPLALTDYAWGGVGLPGSAGQASSGGEGTLGSRCAAVYVAPEAASVDGALPRFFEF